MGESNQKTLETAIGKRRKTDASMRLSCKYDYFSSPENCTISTGYRLITDDQIDLHYSYPPTHPDLVPKFHPLRVQYLA